MMDVPAGTCEWCDKAATWAKETYGNSVADEYAGASFVRACDGHLRQLRAFDPADEYVMRSIPKVAA